jgi:hypothetical protein
MSDAVVIGVSVAAGLAVLFGIFSYATSTNRNRQYGYDVDQTDYYKQYEDAEYDPRLSDRDAQRYSKRFNDSSWFGSSRWNGGKSRRRRSSNKSRKK